MKSFEMHWDSNNNLMVTIHYDSFNVTLSYEKYVEICTRHKWEIMPTVPNNYVGYCINDEWYAPSYIKDENLKKYALTPFKMDIKPAIKAIENYQIIARESNPLQGKEFYPFDHTTTNYNNICSPSCTIL